MPQTTDPLTQLIKDAVMAALEESGRHFSRRLLTTAQAAEYLGIGEDAVRNLHAARKLKRIHIIGAKMLFDLRDLEKLIDTNRE